MAPTKVSVTAKNTVANSSTSARSKSKGPSATLRHINCNGFTSVEFLGAGRFGEVWKGINETTQQESAMKFEYDTGGEQLCREAAILGDIHSCENVQGFPKLLHFGLEDAIQCLVMERLGKSLGEHMRACPQGLQLQSTVLVAQQLLQRLEYLHSCCLLHRDLNPGNIMFGTGARVHHLYLIDFGLSKAYWLKDKTAGAHISKKMYQQVAGTPIYMSASALLGNEQSRRDELQTFGYLILHALVGASFAFLRASNRRGVLELKQQLPLDVCCRSAPEQFQEILEYCGSLPFTARPDYEKLHALVASCRSPNAKDYSFEWLGGSLRGLDFSKLEPLLPRIPTVQPDDPVSTEACKTEEGEDLESMVSVVVVGEKGSVPSTASKKTPARGVLKSLFHRMASFKMGGKKSRTTPTRTSPSVQ